jgi:hypothetical protein
VFLQQGKGLVKVNGQPLSLVQPEILRFKVRTLAPPTPARQKKKGIHNESPTTNQMAAGYIQTNPEN